MSDVRRVSAGDAGTEGEADVATRPLRVLVVDDEPNICAVFADALVRHDYVVTTCTTGEEAIQAAEAESFDAVFIDVMMPGLNGLQVLRALRSRLPEATFIMITGYPDSRLVDGSLASGAFLCLSKPVSLEDVVELLRGISQRSQAG
jgi:two-component system response regulator AtoC